MRTHRDPIHQCVQLKYLVAIILLLCGVVAVPVVEAGHLQAGIRQKTPPSPSPGDGSAPGKTPNLPETPPAKPPETERQPSAPQAESADLRGRLSASQAESADLRGRLSASQAESVDLRGKLSASQAESADLGGKLSASQAERDAARDSAESYSIGAFVLIGLLVAILAYLFAAKRRSLWPFVMRASDPENLDGQLQAKLWRLVAGYGAEEAALPQARERAKERLKAEFYKVDQEVRQTDPNGTVPIQTRNVVCFARLVKGLSVAEQGLDEEYTGLAATATNRLENRLKTRRGQEEKHDRQVRQVYGLEEELLASVFIATGNFPAAIEALSRANKWHHDVDSDRRVWRLRHKIAMAQGEFREALWLLATIIAPENERETNHTRDLPPNFLQVGSPTADSLCDVMHVLWKARNDGRATRFTALQLCEWAGRVSQRLVDAGATPDQKLIIYTRCAEVFDHGRRSVECANSYLQAWSMFTNLALGAPAGDDRGYVARNGPLRNLQNVLDPIRVKWTDEEVELLKRLCIFQVNQAIDQLGGQLAGDNFGLETAYPTIWRTLACATQVMRHICGPEDPAEEAWRTLTRWVERLHQQPNWPGMNQSPLAPEAQQYRQYVEAQLQAPRRDPPPPPPQPKSSPNLWATFDEGEQKILVSDHSTKDVQRVIDVDEIKVRGNSGAPIKTKGLFGTDRGDLAGIKYRPPRLRNSTNHGNHYVELGVVELRDVYRPKEETWNIHIKWGEETHELKVMVPKNDGVPPQQWPAEKINQFCNSFIGFLVCLSLSQPRLRNLATDACRPLFDHADGEFCDFDRLYSGLQNWRRVGADMENAPKLWGQAIAVYPDHSRQVVEKLLGHQRFQELRDVINQEFGADLRQRDDGEADRPQQQHANPKPYGFSRTEESTRPIIGPTQKPTDPPVDPPQPTSGNLIDKVNSLLRRAKMSGEVQLGCYDEAEERLFILLRRFSSMGDQEGLNQARELVQHIPRS